VALRSTLGPDFEAAISVAFELAAKHKRILSVFGSRPAGTSAAGVDLLEGYDPRRVSSLSDAMRRVVERQADAHFGVRPGWRTKAEAKRVRALFDISPAAGFALTTHGSGYVRETALRAISGIPGPFALALLVHRLNDWVHEVRLVAEGRLAGLKERIRPDVVASCVELLWAFDAYGRATPRADQLVASLLRDENVLRILRDGVRASADARSARLLHHLLRSDFMDGELEALATTSRNAAVRAVAMRAALSGSYQWKGAAARRTISIGGDRQALMRRGLRDRSAKVQAAALEWVVENRAVVSEPAALLLPFVLHPAPSVSDLAQFGLTALGVDWLAIARSNLVGAKGPNRFAAAVLARHGNSEDGQRILDAASGLPAGKAVSFLAASARLGLQRGAEQLMAIAFDADDLAAARRAAAALKKVRAVVPAEKLMALADRGNEFFARGFSQFFASLGVLEQLEVMCRWERASADVDLDQWFELARRKINRAAFLPNPSDRDRVFALLRSCPETRSRAKRFLAIDPADIP
jgi:hypothetical protein